MIMCMGIYWHRADQNKTLWANIKYSACSSDKEQKRGKGKEKERKKGEEEKGAKGEDNEKKAIYKSQNF